MFSEAGYCDGSIRRERNVDIDDSNDRNQRQCTSRKNDSLAGRRSVRIGNCTAAGDPCETPALDSVLRAVLDYQHRWSNRVRRRWEQSNDDSLRTSTNDRRQLHVHRYRNRRKRECQHIDNRDRHGPVGHVGELRRWCGCFLTHTFRNTRAVFCPDSCFQWHTIRCCDVPAGRFAKDFQGFRRSIRAVASIFRKIPFGTANSEMVSQGRFDRDAASLAR